MARRHNPNYMTPQQLHLWKRQISQSDRHNERLYRDAERAETTLEDAEAAADKRVRKAKEEAQTAYVKRTAEWAAAEKQVLTAPRTVYRGATRGLSYMWVTHAKATMPESLRQVVGASSGDIHNFVRLQPGGGIGSSETAPAVIARARPEVINDRDYREWSGQVDELVRDATLRYPRLGKLRNDEWLADVLGAAGVTTSETVESPIQGTYGTYSRKVTVITVPILLGVQIARTGLCLAFAHQPGRSAKSWNAKLDVLKSTFNAAGISADELVVSDGPGGNLLLFFNDADPFADMPTGHVAPYDAKGNRSLLGIDNRGHDIFLEWANNSGAVIGGVPGSGKTASMLPVFAGMAGHCEMHVFDGKAGHDLDPLMPICATYDNSADLEPLLRVLEQVDRTAVARSDALYRETRVSNFWNIPVAEREKRGMYPIFVVIDESPRWLDSRGKPKEEKALCEAIAAKVRELVLKRRAAGVVVCLTAQKPDANNMPTDLRDNAAIRVAFKTSTGAQAETILGSQDPDAPSPTRIAMADKGRFVMEAEGRGLTLGQAPYVPPADLDDYLRDFRPVTPQARVARQMNRSATQAVSRPQAPAPVVEPDPEPAHRALTDDELMDEMRRRGLAVGSTGAPGDPTEDGLTDGPDHPADETPSTPDKKGWIR